MASNIQTAKSTKTKLGEKYLEGLKVFYHEDVFPGNGHCHDGSTTAGKQRTVSRLPDQIERLRIKLLGTDKTIPEKPELRKIFKKEHSLFKSDEILPNLISPPDSAWWEGERGLYTTVERNRKNYQVKEIKEAHDQATEFERLTTRESEPAWTYELLDFLFQKYDKARPGHREARHRNFTDEWKLEQNLSWTEVKHIEIENEHVDDEHVDDEHIKGKRRMPVPDFTYGFPILGENELGGLDVESKNVAVFTEDFHKKIFDDEKEIVTSPSVGIRNAVTDGSEMRQPHRICFPWAIVEVKRDNDEDKGDAEKQCYWQASNGAAAALKLQASFHEKLDRTGCLSAVVAFTCIGPEVKTWIAYLDGKATEVVCIHKTNLRTTWGTYSTRLIVENMLNWAKDDVRGNVVKYLNTLRRPTSWSIESPGSAVRTPSPIQESLVVLGSERRTLFPRRSNAKPGNEDLQQKTPRASSLVESCDFAGSKQKEALHDGPGNQPDSVQEERNPLHLDTSLSELFFTDQQSVSPEGYFTALPQSAHPSDGPGTWINDRLENLSLNDKDETQIDASRTKPKMEGAVSNGSADQPPAVRTLDRSATGDRSIAEVLEDQLCTKPGKKNKMRMFKVVFRGMSESTADWKYMISLKGSKNKQKLSEYMKKRSKKPFAVDDEA